ncbi:MAG: hypothetical protein QOF71_2645 [Candidatus Eremiobacteraeota bacterium]|jgi:hypothetical protein|nr:hypothetical protein [Candidatus Eremiobacteraeota bacterium]
MHSISKIVSLAAIAVGTAFICAAGPSRGQAAQQPALGNIAAPAQAVCCTPAQQPVLTDASWTVKPPKGPVMNAVVVTNPNPGWHAPIQGAQWIANVADAGLGPHLGGTYIYRTTFCLCHVPKGLASVPAAMYLSILADNSFSASLNGNSPFATGGPTAFMNPTNVTVPASQFVQGNNVLEIQVSNLPSSPTGLAVSGWIAGYFQQVPPGAHCQ